jgi:hypothetical protein
MSGLWDSNRKSRGDVMRSYFRRASAIAALLASLCIVRSAGACPAPLGTSAELVSESAADWLQGSPPDSTLGAPVDSAGAVPEAGGTLDSTAAPEVAPRSELEPTAPHSRSKLVPLRDARHGVETLIGDSWFVITSPTRMRLHDALLTLGIGIAAGVAYAHDQEITDAFQRSRGQPLYDLMIKPGRAIEPVGNMGNTLAYYVGGLLIGYAFHLDPLRELTSEFIESHFVSGGARNIAEVTIGRSRPFEDHGPYFFKFQGGSSFPSGHASVVMELATILSHHVHSLPFSIAAYGAATIVCLERIDGKGHWSSDVVVGAATGQIIAKRVVRLHEQRRAARHGQLGWRDAMRPIGGWREGAPFLGYTTRF